MMEKLKVVALLTGRGNNTLKDKNILNVLGHPLLYYPATAAKKCKLITDFYCSSDDEKILSVAETCGYKRILRPAEFSRPDSQHIDVIRHSVSVMEKNGCHPDILVVLLANSAIVLPAWITESINQLARRSELSAVVPVTEEMDSHPFRAKRLREDGCLEPWFDFSGKRISTNRQDLPKNYVLCHNFWTLNLHHCTFDGNHGQQPWTFMGNNIFPIVVDESFDVHDMDDVQRTERWLKLHEMSKSNC